MSFVPSISADTPSFPSTLDFFFAFGSKLFLSVAKSTTFHKMQVVVHRNVYWLVFGILCFESTLSNQGVQVIVKVAVWISLKVLITKAGIVELDRLREDQQKEGYLVPRSNLQEQVSCDIVALDNI